jgi:hypothetical protein
MAKTFCEYDNKAPPKKKAKGSYTYQGGSARESALIQLLVYLKSAKVMLTDFDGNGGRSGQITFEIEGEEKAVDLFMAMFRR